MLKGNPKILIPNFFTGMNMFIGLVSIFYSINGDFFNAAWLIMLSAVLDKLDGTTARLFNASSDFGVEFDSFSDFVSFSLAPAILVFSYFSRIIPGSKIMEHPYFVAIVPIYVIFCAVRLARYNSYQSDDHDYFSGLTSTMSGGMIAAYMAFAIENTETFGFLLSTDIVAGMMFIQACLMLLPFKYPKLKMPKNKIVRVFSITYFLFLCCLIFMRRLPWLLYITSILYVIIGVLRTRKITVSISNMTEFDPEKEEQN
ncbi:phosphatidylcholine/phosphatidylserine synthase [bacterium]|jgi:CDP-diacylglycerol--serine O-phosphatidyltransferase|nr:phosphatidylcholine/phosphatidylserine synthase [bacterium]